MKIGFLLTWTVAISAVSNLLVADASPAADPEPLPTSAQQKQSGDRSEAAATFVHDPNLVGKNPESTEGKNNSEQRQTPQAVPYSTPAPLNQWNAGVEQNFYTWSNSLGSTGFQSVTPITLTYQQNDWDFGIRSAYIVSGQDVAILDNGRKVGSQSGSVSTLSDTSLSAAYNLRDGDFPVRFNLDLNMPTGKATLSGNERLAVMDSSLVRQTRFGEGFNIAPGISVSTALGDRDVVGIGASYVIRGPFNPNGDLINNEIKPGNDLVGTMQYQHVDSNWSLLGGLTYTNSGVSQRGGLNDYQKGDRLDLNLIGTYAPSVQNRLQLTARYFTQGPDGINTPAGTFQKEATNNNSNALYLGLDWGWALDSRQQNTLHFLVDWLGVQANSYDRVTELFDGGRSKFSIGLGYEVISSPTTSWNVQARYFTLLNRSNPVTPQDVLYNGLSVFAALNLSF
jgi:hypothetical protein